ncbi:WD40 repeat domain-containing protein [Anabaenopsis sp. FSS-46]|uniref:WD40 repeat domain-containing protein n=1 Tax=Anabaenopsis sp. FSS-46 TaxID=2971766 RepID=UPI00247591AA|nr:WD40 repeat domain-containing protein [Anabaenopsis sp. FSS-46]MDH6097264.1 WD40 repeat domain-containing protein [Anabaenopsis sp. FSS-46]
MNQRPEPVQFDVVLVGTGNAPELVAVLGRIQGLLRDYSSPDPKTRVKAISQALQYGDEGVNLLLQALSTDESADVKDAAYNLLVSKYGKLIEIIQALKTYKSRKSISSWQLQYTTAHTDAVNSVAFSPDGRTLASGSWETIKLWDVATRLEIASLTEGVISVVFSPDGCTLASGGYETIKLWDVSTLREITSLKGHSDGVNSVAFSPSNGHILASSGSEDETIKLWDVVNRGEIASINRGSVGVGSVAFSPDGRTLASGVDNIKLWDVATLQEITSLPGHSNYVNSVAFSPDSRTLASGDRDGSIKIWQRR